MNFNINIEIIKMLELMTKSKLVACFLWFIASGFFLFAIASLINAIRWW